MTKDQRKALVGTIVVHAVLLVALFFFAFVTPLPLPGEEGVEVNLGYMDQGMGKVQPKPKKVKETPKPEPKPKVTPPKPQEQVKEELVTQKTDEAPALDDKKEEKKPDPKQEEKPKEEIKEQPKDTVQTKVEEKPEPVPEPEPVADPRLMYGGPTNTDSEGGNEGITGQAGDQGKPTGSVEADRYEGLGGTGDGVSFSLGNRKSKDLPLPKYDSEDQGRVVVPIWVNRYGEVTKVQAGARGTTVSDPRLLKYSETAAKKAKFNSDPDAPEIQKGTITYTFVKLN
jgi:hypothetical protein